MKEGGYSSLLSGMMEERTQEGDDSFLVLYWSGLWIFGCHDRTLLSAEGVAKYQKPNTQFSSGTSDSGRGLTYEKNFSLFVLNLVN